MGKLFGTDGVRGLANDDLTPEMAFKLGRSATVFFGREYPRPVFVIGRDTRISGGMLEAALAAGICSAGGEAVLAGIIPTPAVAHLTRRLGAQAGVVISASHNPYHDNGIKFFSGAGFKLPDAVEDELESLVLSDRDAGARPVGNKVGTISDRPELLELYADYAAGTISGDLTGLKVVVDCANGAAYRVAPEVLKRLGAAVEVINAHPTGVNINQECGSTHLNALQEAVVRAGAHVGLAYDGDADRCLAVDETGNPVDGDAIMVICGLDLLRRGELKDNTVVVTVMSNLGLHQAIKKAGGKVMVTPVGDRYVIEAIEERDLSFGGEQSGHLIFRQFSTTGDGLVTSLQLLSRLKASGKPLSELAKAMTRFPQVLKNVRVKNKHAWKENPAIIEAIRQAEQALGENGRLLVRPSGTEPLIRVMAEGPDEFKLHRLVENVIMAIKKELD